MNGKQAQPSAADDRTASVRAAPYRGEPHSPKGPSGCNPRRYYLQIDVRADRALIVNRLLGLVVGGSGPP
jgi:hypothetical protein